MTPLHFAAAVIWDYLSPQKDDRDNVLGIKRVQLVNRLLELGMDVNKRGWQRWTSLHDAACNWNPEIAKTLRSKFEYDDTMQGKHPCILLLFWEGQN